MVWVTHIFPTSLQETRLLSNTRDQLCPYKIRTRSLLRITASHEQLLYNKVTLTFMAVYKFYLLRHQPSFSEIWVVGLHVHNQLPWRSDHSEQLFATLIQSVHYHKMEQRKTKIKQKKKSSHKNKYRCLSVRKNWKKYVQNLSSFFTLFSGLKPFLLLEMCLVQKCGSRNFQRRAPTQRLGRKQIILTISPQNYMK